MSLGDTVNDGRRCGAPDALSYLLGILFFAPSPSEQTLMNVNAVESYLQMEKNLLVAIASPIRQTVKEKWSCRLPCISLHNPLFYPSNKGKILTLLCLNQYYALECMCLSEPNQELSRAFQHFKRVCHVQNTLSRL